MNNGTLIAIGIAAAVGTIFGVALAIPSIIDQAPEAGEIAEGDTTETGCSIESISSFRGVNFAVPILVAKHDTIQNFNAPIYYVSKSLKILHDNGFNLIRVPYHWEAFESYPDNFLNGIENIASEADRYDICVIFDFHQYRTSSYFGSGQSGFPWFLLQNYAKDDPMSQKSFWADFYDDEIIVDGKSAWDWHVDFITQIIERVDKYDSVLGYEIINEPHAYDNSQFDKIGKYHKYIAQNIRKQTEKYIFFDEPIPAKKWGGAVILRTSQYLIPIAPSGVSNTVFAPHIYKVPAPNTWASNQIAKYKTLSNIWGGLPVFIGEFAAGNEEDMNAFIDTFEQSEFGYAYWIWKPKTIKDDTDLNKTHLINNDLEPTIYLQYLSNSVSKYHGESNIPESPNE
ncbi:MAG: glycoside hydrolase family 5 protein [Nitrososphaerales archaeon]